MNSMKNKIWKLTAIISLLLAVVTFSPLVIPYNVYVPELFGLPYTLWTGILMSFLMLANTILAIIVQPKK